MNGRWLLICSLLYFGLAYAIYGKFLSKRFGVDAGKPCPSHTKQDGIDYVPTNPAVLFGHHFASIAGAGPIIGPVVAASFGWMPAFLWIVIGCVFIGAMHDFAAMFISIRNEGRSIASCIEGVLGYLGRQIFLLFCLFSLILVVAIFTLNVADGFIANPAVATSSMLFIVIAPIFGICLNRRILTLTEGSLVFVPLLFLLVWVGTLIPSDLALLLGSPSRARVAWIIGLLYYVTCASILPVWLLLQPRDYLNSYLLYVMMLLGILGIVFAKPDLQLAAINIKEGCTVPNVFPLLFVTIACGACSGFHAMVASGTSAKQIDKESHILPIAYGGMLLEGVLAIIAIISVAYLKTDDMVALLSGANKVPAPIAFAKGLAHFCTSLGLSYEVCYNFMSLAISAFLLTSLDTATRLARFIWQEFMTPRNACNTVAKSAECNCHVRKFVNNRWTATFIVVICSAVLAISGEGNRIWPVFGASNQLLAALTLLAVSLWLMRKKCRALFALLPMLFMFVISIWALACLVLQEWSKNWILVGFSIVLIILAIFLGVLAIVKVSSCYGKKK